METTARPPSVFLAVPHYGSLVPQSLRGLIQASEKASISLVTNGASLLAHNFNRLWCDALALREERKLTHFAMHHSDIEAAVNWVDTLLAEMQRVEADVMATIIPIKDPTGLTTTGLINPENPMVVERRFTMREVCRFPKTFDSAGLGFSGKWLAINTGLWLCRFTEKWVDEFSGFAILDAIKGHADGIRRAAVLSEDWNFSRWCGQQGLRVFATRAVHVNHHGPTAYPNHEPWGTWESDLGDEVRCAEILPGWAYKEELDWLRHAANKAQVVVEIGSWAGRTTQAMAESCPGVIYAVDHFQGSPDDSCETIRNAARNGEGAKARQEFQRNLKRFLDSGKVVLMETFSVPAAYIMRREMEKTPDFVFLDGAHDYTSVHDDIVSWLPLIRKGGILCGHDRDLPSVRQAIDELLPGWKPAAGRIWEYAVN
jgi:predicted O-methyltransferase YrrM